MILVSLGTQDKQFTRLLDMIQKLIDDKIINEEVIVQSGYTKYKSENMQIFDYVCMEKFNSLLNECDLLITHGGVGTIMSALKIKKPVIACARLSKYHEHHNDHQCEIINSFSDSGYLIKCDDQNDLKHCLIQVKQIEMKDVVSNNLNFIKLLEKYIGE